MKNHNMIIGNGSESSASSTIASTTSSTMATTVSTKRPLTYARCNDILWHMQDNPSWHPLTSARCLFYNYSSVKFQSFCAFRYKWLHRPTHYMISYFDINNPYSETPVKVSVLPLSSITLPLWPPEKIDEIEGTAPEGDVGAILVSVHQSKT